MTTADARTNAIGHTVSGVGGALTQIGVPVNHLKVESKGRGSSMFPLEKHVKPHPNRKPASLGAMIGSDNNNINIMANAIFEDGSGLRGEIKVMLSYAGTGNPEMELWTNINRYKVLRGRVYAHRRVSK